jgi:Phage tail tube protein, TTP
MAEIVTATGAKFYIGPAGTSAQYDSLAEFQAISSWVEVGLVENLGEFGDEASAVTGAALGDGRIRKAKGARDAGTMNVIVFHDPLDAGQADLRTAETTNDNYTFRVVLPDAPAGYSNTERFFRGLVMSYRLNVGTNDNILRYTAAVGVNSEVFDQPAAVSP